MDTTKFRELGASAAAEDIAAGNRCDLAAIDEGAVLAHVGLEYGGITAETIAEQLREDGADETEIASEVGAAADAALDGYRSAMAEALPRCEECGSAFDPECGDSGGVTCSKACTDNLRAGDREVRA